MKSSEFEVYCSDTVLQHCKDPNGYEKRPDWPYSKRGQIEECGDDITIYANMCDSSYHSDFPWYLSGISWYGDACELCTTAASLIVATFSTKSVLDVLEAEEDLFLASLGTPISTNRRDCFLLPLRIIKSLCKPLTRSI